MNFIVALFLSLSAFADSCPVGNLKACQDYLKLQQNDPESSFIEKYNEVCNANPTFSCIKVIVRGDMNEEMKEQTKKRGPKAALYSTKVEGETYVFVLTEKPVKK